MSKINVLTTTLGLEDGEECLILAVAVKYGVTGTPVILSYLWALILHMVVSGRYIDQ